MKFQRGFFCLFCLLFSLGVFAQTKPEMDAAKIAQARADRIKADILQEIRSLSTPEQVSFYTSLGNAYWLRDRREALFWLGKSAEIGTSPSTDYKDTAHKLKVLTSFFYSVLEKDVALSDRVFAAIKEIKIDEADEKLLEIANEEYLSLARTFFNRKNDEKLAFEFAMLSLKGKKPAVNWDAVQFFKELNAKNLALADRYFAAKIAAARSSGDLSIRYLFHYYEEYLVRKNNDSQPSLLSDAQKKALLELVFPFIQNEAEALALKKIEHCDATRRWGVVFADEFRRFLPEKIPFLEQAIAVCNAAAFPEWAKPDYLKKPRKTVQDLLDRSKEVSDKRIEVFYLRLAAQEAHDQRNHRRSLEILEMIEKEFRDYLWIIIRINSAVDLMNEYLRKEDFAEIAKILEDSPPEQRPFLIVRSISQFYLKFKPENLKYVAELLDQARAGFNRIEEFRTDIMYLNPTHFAALPGLYLKYGFEDEALATHGEAIGSFNRVVKKLPANLKEKNIIPRWTFFARFTNQSPPKDTEFVDRNFERIYENIGRIENPQARLTDRLIFLGRILAMIPPNLKQISEL